AKTVANSSAPNRFIFFSLSSGAALRQVVLLAVARTSHADAAAGSARSESIQAAAARQAENTRKRRRVGKAAACPRVPAEKGHKRRVGTGLRPFAHPTASRRQYRTGARRRDRSYST